MPKAAHLRLVAPAKNPWDQQSSEPDEAYELFWMWLGKPFKLTADEAKIADEFAWTERAAAFEKAVGASDPKFAKLESILNDALKIAGLEMRKLLNRVQITTENQLTMRDMMLVLAFARDNSEIYGKLLHGEQTGMDLTELSDAELETLLSASKVAKKLGGSNVR